LGLLRAEYGDRVAASNAFPPDISPSDIRSSIANYEVDIATASNKAVCCSCGRLVYIKDLFQVTTEDPLLDLLEGKLDACAKHGDLWDLCSPCHKALRDNKPPRFSAANSVNMILCPHYPSVLEDLTVTEECLIAKAHPVGVILKLRPGGRASPLNYHALRGHFIVIPQDPGPLLQILPSPELHLHHLIKVFWLGDRPPTDTDFKPFLLVRKHNVLAALQYLVCHNHLYRGIAINYHLIDSWSDDFIPPELQDSIICLHDADHHEREGYTVNLSSGNYENDLQAAEDDTLHSGHDVPLMTGSVATDINGERLNPDMHMLHTLVDAAANREHELSSVPSHLLHGNQPSNQRNIPVISYTTHGLATPINHWDDPYYFTAAFPTLFPTGFGGHLDERKVPISLAAFAEWALSHHSRRYTTFINKI